MARSLYTGSLVAHNEALRWAIEIADQLDRSSLQELSKGHRRTEPDRS